MADTQMRALARRIRLLEQDRLNRKQPSLGYSSIGDGAVTVTDSDDNLTMVIGTQYDGTQTSAELVGPPPPTPQQPLAEGHVGGIRVYWDGTFFDGSVAPMDFARVTVHIHPMSTFEDYDPLDQTHIVGTFTSATGGEILVPVASYEEHVVYLVAWSRAGKFSEASIPAFATRAKIAPVDIDDSAIEAPAESPAVTVDGTADGLVIRANPIDPSTLLSYHVTSTVSEDSNGDPIPFTPSEETLAVGPTAATVVVVTQLPDGSRLAPDTSYYVRVVASNDVGEADPGPMGVGGLDPSVVSDLVTSQVSAGFGLFGTVQVGQITIDPDAGITVPTPKGEIHLPSDGTAATFRGSLQSDDVTVENNLTVNGEDNSINGALSLANLVTAPTATPLLGQTWVWDVTIGGDTWSLGESPDGTEWVSVHFPTDTIRHYSKATGALTKTWGPYPGWRLASVTSLGANYYAAVKRESNADVYVLRISGSTGEILSNWKVTDASDSNGLPGIGRFVDDDNVQLLVAWEKPGGLYIRMQSYTTTGDPITGLSFHTEGTPAGSGNTAVTNVGRAPVGPGGEWRTWMVVGSIPMVFRDSDRKMDFYPYRPESTKGLIWTNDGEFRWLGYNTYRVYKFSLNMWDNPVMARFSWYDNDPGGTGTHETQAGPASGTFKPWAWSYLTVQTPPPNDTGQPDDPNAVRIYIDPNAGSGVYHRQPDLGTGVTSATYPAVISSGVTPPTTNGFAGALTHPGLVRSEAEDSEGPLIELSGSGSGRVGPLRWTQEALTFHNRPLNEYGEAELGSTTTLTTTSQYLGMRVQMVSTGPTDVFEVIGVLDVNTTTGGTSVAVGELRIDNTPQDRAIIYHGPTTGMRGTSAQTWRITGLSAGSHNFDLWAYRTSGTGGYAAQATHTVISVKRLIA